MVMPRPVPGPWNRALRFHFPVAQATTGLDEAVSVDLPWSMWANGKSYECA